jgi:hypothetical protein
MVLRTDRLWAGGNVHGATFAAFGRCLKDEAGDGVNDCVSLIWDSDLNRKEHF